MVGPILQRSKILRKDEQLHLMRRHRMTTLPPAFFCPLPLVGEGGLSCAREGREDLFPFADENTSLIYANEIKDQVLCPNLQT
ncbi:MAG: hypothetical protein WBC82_07430, partial [Dehalococcoidia bacterium]